VRRHREGKPRFALNIYHKLVALIVALLVTVVGALAIYLSSHQLGAMTAALRTKATTYGAVMSSQVISAVAFDDHETAREVLRSIDADTDVASVTLYGANGQSLYARGKPMLASATAATIATARVIDETSRIAAVTPVVSLEGPRGVLVIELSTDSLRAARAHVRWLALVTGLIAVAAGVIAAWLIARRFARRLRAIANVASAVAGGDLTQQAIDDPRRDEIGVLAAAFNAMMVQIKQLFADAHDLARKEQVRLESLVAKRTAQLDQRNAEMQLVFDEVDQGLFMVDLDGALASERSAAVERLLGPVPASGLLKDYVAQFAPDAAAWFGLQWETLREDVMPREVCLDQLPVHFEVGRRHLELAYKLTDANGRPRVLVVISDVTAQIHRRRAERDERETASLVSRLLRGRVGFLAFHAEAEGYIAIIEGDARDGAAFRRAVHTLKGISALEGIDSIAEACHALETAIEDGDELATAASVRALTARWALVMSKIAPLIAEASARLELLPEDLAQLEDAIRAGAAPAELLATIGSWFHERVQPRLQRFADDALVLATRLGKGPLEVHIEVADGLRIPSERWAGFWTAFVHAIRNAIDHGLESPEERVAVGKPQTAHLTFRASRRGDELAVEIEDDGRGIAWPQVAERARMRGMPFAEHADLVEALFHEGFTTRDTATEISGRGIGLSALRHACVSSGGGIAVTSRSGAGTTFAFRWPNTAARPDILQLTAV
jgi:two-component system, chemotaxis family, sensor kinase CheA